MNPRALFLEVKCEFLKLIREPTYAVFTLGFPLMFYVLFGLVLSPSGKRLATYLLGTYGTFGVMGVALFGFGVGLAIERGLGWLELKRASPLPPVVGLLAKGVVTMLFSAALTGCLFALAYFGGGVRLDPRQWMLLAVTLVAGSLPFSVMGLAIGQFTKANSAPAVVNVIYLPMSVCSGLWMPLDVLPEALQKAAPLLPPFHLSQLALSAIGVPVKGEMMTHIGALAAFTLIFAGIALYGHSRERARI